MKMRNPRKKDGTGFVIDKKIHYSSGEAALRMNKKEGHRLFWGLGRGRTKRIAELQGP